MKLLLRTCPELAKIENSEGKTPLAIAKEKNNQLCAELVHSPEIQLVPWLRRPSLTYIDVAVFLYLSLNTLFTTYQTKKIFF